MQLPQPLPAEHLLAVDLGLRAGLAWFERNGRLVRCRSTHFANRSSLRRALPGIWQEVPGVTHLVLEGGGDLANIWMSSARRQKITVHLATAEEWREELLLLREQRSGQQAKANAVQLTQQVLRWSGLSHPGQLRHDACEAVLCGLWMARRMNWLTEWPLA